MIPPAKRLLITGTRHGWDEMHLRAALQEQYDDLSQYGQQVILIHGAADGVDSQAAAIWHEMGLEAEAYPALWRVYGIKAGPLRNAEMVARGADRCIAFPGSGSVGTVDCMTKARRAGIPVVTYRQPSTPPPPVLDGQLGLFQDGED